MWNYQEVEVKVVQMDEHHIHAKVYDLDQKLHYCLTVVYSFNQLEKRKVLWKTMESLGSNVPYPWIAMWDFNNVITCQDKIGGNSVTEGKYRDLGHLMNINGLYEAATKGAHFTWSNNHSNGVIYSRIDHMLGNME